MHDAETEAPRTHAWAKQPPTRKARTLNISEPTAPHFNDDPVALFAGLLLTGAMIGLLAVVALPGVSEVVLPEPPAPQPGPPDIRSLPPDEAEDLFHRRAELNLARQQIAADRLRRAQLVRAEQQLAALRERALLNPLVLRGRARIPPADLLVPRNAVIAVGETCPDGWDRYVNADGEPLYFPFAFISHEGTETGSHHASLLAACRRP